MEELADTEVYMKEIQINSSHYNSDNIVIVETLLYDLNHGIKYLIKIYHFCLSKI